MSKSFGKLPIAMSVVGALCGIAASYLWTVPTSSAVIRLSATSPTGQRISSDIAALDLQERIVWLRGMVVRRSFLLLLMRDRSLDLLAKERAVFPDEDVADQFIQSGAIRILPIDAHEDESIRAVDVRISCAYPDRAKARGVVTRLVAAFGKENEAINNTRAEQWQRLWHQPIPWSDFVAVLEPPGLPALFTQQSAVFLLGGAAAGILLALAWITVSASPGRAWRVAAGALLGGACAFGASMLVTAPLMTPCSARAVLRVNNPFDPLHYSGLVPPLPLTTVVDRLNREILGGPGEQSLASWRVASDESRAEIRVLRDANPAAPSSAFEVWSSDPDENIAKRVTFEIVARIMLYVADPALSRSLDAMDVGVVSRAEIVPPESYRGTSIAAGLLLGVIAGASLTVPSKST